MSNVGYSISNNSNSEDLKSWGWSKSDSNGGGWTDNTGGWRWINTTETIHPIETSPPFPSPPPFTLTPEKMEELRRIIVDEYENEHKNGRIDSGGTSKPKKEKPEKKRPPRMVQI